MHPVYYDELIVIDGLTLDDPAQIRNTHARRISCTLTAQLLHCPCRECNERGWKCLHTGHITIVQETQQCRAGVTCNGRANTEVISIRFVRYYVFFFLFVFFNWMWKQWARIWVMNIWGRCNGTLSQFITHKVNVNALALEHVSQFYEPTMLCMCNNHNDNWVAFIHTGKNAPSFEPFIYFWRRRRQDASFQMYTEKVLISNRLS